MYKRGVMPWHEFAASVEQEEREERERRGRKRDRRKVAKVMGLERAKPVKFLKAATVADQDGEEVKANMFRLGTFRFFVLEGRVYFVYLCARAGCGKTVGREISTVRDIDARSPRDRFCSDHAE